jgi:SAM-dependent methyltransferase
VDSKKQTEFFYEMFDASLPRLGAGNEASTKKAFDTMLAAMSQGKGEPILRPTRILDIGCGNGPQTIFLAKHLDRSILAVDNHPPFLEELKRRAATAGVGGKIQISLRDMRTLTKDDGPFDLIWSEGAIFVVGFREGLAAWRPLLAPGGGLAVSEIAWLRADVPAECREFFAQVHPAMASVGDHLAAIEACGYEILEHFVEPESAWWDGFYRPLESRLGTLRTRYAADAERLTMIEPIQNEIDIYRKHSAYYGNVFYLMRRR